MFATQNNGEESLSVEDGCPSFDQYQEEGVAYRGKIDVPYLIVSTVILPIFLLFEWIREWYGNVDYDDDWQAGPKVAALSGIVGTVLTHMVLTPMYLRRTSGSVRLHLIPVLAIMTSNFLILVGENIAPTCVMAGSMLFMVAVIHRSDSRMRYNGGGSQHLLHQRLLDEREDIDEETQS